MGTGIGVGIRMKCASGFWGDIVITILRAGSGLR